MQNKKSFLIIFIIINILSIILLNIFNVNKNIIFSFEFAFLCSFLIIIVSFYAYKKNISKINTKSKIKNLFPFFNIFKLISYGVLVIGFIILHDKQLLDIFAFVGGIFAMILVIFVFVLRLKNDKL